MNRVKRGGLRVCGRSFAVAFLTLARPVLAANAADIDAAPVEEIVVLGSKSNTPLKDLPASVVALDQAQLEESRIEFIRDLDTVLPNLSLSSTGQGAAVGATIRGIGTGVGNLQRVAVYIDDVPYREVDLQALPGVTRVELLRGPQGTLYGANAEGGVLAIFTVDPRRAPELETELTGEDFARGFKYGARGFAVGRLSDRLAGAVSAFTEQGDSFVRNVGATDGRSGTLDEYAGLAKLTVEITSWLEANVTLIAEMRRGLGIADEDALPLDRSAYDAATTDANSGRRIGRYERLSDTRKDLDDDEVGMALRLVGELQGLKITSVTAIRSEGSEARGRDLDDTLAPTLGEDVHNRRQALAQELRVTGGTSVDWLLGASFNADDTTGTTSRQAFAPEFASTTRRETGRATDLAAFAQLRLPFAADAAHVALGGRIETSLRRGSTGSVTEQARDHRFLPRVAVDWSPMADLKTYGSVARGWRPGGVNPGAPSGEERFGAEDLWSYEVGVKYAPPHLPLTLNLAVFATVADQWQELKLEPGGVAVILADTEVRSRGTELEFTWHPDDAWSLTGGIGITSAEYRRGDREGSPLAGRALPLAPDYDGYVAVQRNWSHGLSGRVAMNAVGQQSLEPLGRAKDAGHTLLSAQLGWTAGEWAVRLFADNLLDEEYAAGPARTSELGPVNLWFAAPGPPRIVGLEIRKGFDAE